MTDAGLPTPLGDESAPRLRTSSTQLTSAQLLCQVSILIAAIIYARALGPHGRGLYFLIVSTVVILNILLNMGFGSFAVVAAGRGDETIARLFGASLTISGAIEVLCCVVGFALFPILRTGPLRGLTLGMAALAFILTGFSVLASYLVQILIGFRLTKVLAISTVVTEFVADGTGIVLVEKYHFGLGGALVGLTINALATVLAMATICWVYGGRPRFEMSTHQVGLLFGVKKYVGLAAAYLLLRLDVYVLNIFRNPSAVGVYSVAEALSEKLWLFTAIFAQVAYPVISGASQEAGAAITARLSRMSIIIGTLSATFMVLVCWPGISWAFGSAYEPAFLMIVFFMPGIVVMGIARAVDPYLAGTLFRPLLSALVAGIALVAALPIYIVFIYAWGGDGAAVATSLVYVIYSFVSWLAYKKNGGSDRLFVPYRKDFEDLWLGVKEIAHRKQ